MVVGSLVRLVLVVVGLVVVGEAFGVPALTILIETLTWTFETVVEWLIDLLSPW